MLLCEVFVKKKISFCLEEHSFVLAFLLNTDHCKLFIVQDLVKVSDTT